MTPDKIMHPLAKHMRTFSCLGVLAILTWLTFSPGLGGGFVFDDYPNIVDNPLVHPAHATIAELAGAALSSPSSELKRPLASLSFAANFLTTGLDSSAMRATNIVLHVLNGWLVFFLCRRLLLVTGTATARRRIDLGAFAMALAWSVAPINLTAVLYIVQRMESLANLFVLVGLLGYLRLRSRASFAVRDTVLCAIWLVAFTSLGLLAKETAVLLPLYALCLEATVLRQNEFRPRGKRPLAIMYAIILGVPLVLGTAWVLPGVLAPQTWAARDFTLATRLMSESRVVLNYLAWTLVPTPSELSFYHDSFAASTSLLQPWTTVPAMLGIVLLCLAGWALRGRAPLASLGILWFLACQTLTATVLPLELVYEHRNYFASLGVILVITEAWRRLARIDHPASLRAAARALVFVLLVWSMALSFTTANAWGTPLSLAEELGRRGPDSHRAQYELGRAYIIASRYDRASPYIAKAVPPLEAAAAMPGASILAEQALIFMYAKAGLPVETSWWTSMRTKLLERPATVQDESALGALASCLRQGDCRFDASDLRKMFDAAMDHPSPSGRLCAIYADFAAISLDDHALALRLSESAVAKSPYEPVYRINLARRALSIHDGALAREQIDALRKLNFAGRLDGDIASLERQLPSTADPSTP